LDVDSLMDSIISPLMICFSSNFVICVYKYKMVKEKLK